jgi:hypothetical protein
MSTIAYRIGYHESNVRRWRADDPDFATAMDHALRESKGAKRRKLEHVLWCKAESEDPKTPGVGQSINVLANIHYPELRDRGVKIDAKVTGAPSSEASRANLLALVGRSDAEA